MLLDFIKLDYEKLQQYLYEQWDEDIDTKTSSTGTRMLKVLSSVGYMNIVYLKKSFKNAIYSEANDRNIIVKKARSEKGYKVPPIVSAYVTITFTIENTRASSVIIPKWTKITTQDLDPNFTFYTIEDVSIPAGETTVDVLAVEGERIQLTYVASGASYETFEIKRDDVTLRELEVYVNSTQWELIDDIIDASATDLKCTYEPGDDGRIKIMFGNNTYGKRLSINDTIDIYCLISSGTDGNIKSNIITKVDTVIYDAVHQIVTDISCNNAAKPYGGAAMETITDIIPNSYSAYKSAWGLVTLQNFNDAIVRLNGVDRVDCIDINTSIEVPFRQIWGYVVDSDGNDIVDPYKSEVEAYVDEHKIIGTEFYIKPVSYTNYVFEVDVWIQAGYVPSTVVDKITNLINTTFSKSGMDISADVEIANIGAEINAMEEVAHYDIKSPLSNVTVAAGSIANATTVTVTIQGII